MPTRRPIPEHLAAVFAWLRLNAPRAAATIAEAWAEDDELAARMLEAVRPLHRAHQRAERQRRKVEAV